MSIMDLLGTEKFEFVFIRPNREKEREKMIE